MSAYLNAIAPQLQQRIKENCPSITNFVVKQEWPKRMGDSISTIVYERATNLGFAPFSHTLRSYKLQHSAIESDSTSEEDVDTFVETVRYCWETRIQEEIARLVDHKYLVVKEPERYLEGCQIIALNNLPRTNLFGRLVYPFETSSDGKCLINKKFYDCPRRVAWFHSDSIHFMFPDLDNWAGLVRFTDTHDYPRFRCVMTVAAKPVHTELGCVFTIIPRGFRGSLYQLMWYLLGISH